MKRLKQGIIAVSRATRLRLLLEPALGAALAGHQGLGRCLAWSYRRCWPPGSLYSRFHK